MICGYKFTCVGLCGLNQTDSCYLWQLNGCLISPIQLFKYAKYQKFICGIFKLMHRNFCVKNAEKLNGMRLSILANSSSSNSYIP